MTREERIKIYNHIKSNNYETLEFEDDEDIRKLCLKQNEALEQAISDMQILDKIQEKLKEDIKITDNIINEREYRYIQEVIDEAYEKNHYAKEILDLIKEK